MIEENKQKKLKFILIVSGVIAIALVFGAVYFFNRDMKKDAGEAAPEKIEEIAKPLTADDIQKALVKMAAEEKKTDESKPAGSEGSQSAPLAADDIQKALEKMAAGEKKNPSKNSLSKSDIQSALRKMSGQ